MKKSLTVLEYVVFIVPYWLVPVMSVTGLMWYAANRAQWSSIPFALFFMLFTIIGLVTLTRVFIRRLRGISSISAVEALLLLIGLATCVAPVIDLYIHRIPNATYALESDKYFAAFAFLRPAPVYIHWLISGLCRSPTSQSA